MNTFEIAVMGRGKIIARRQKIRARVRRHQDRYSEITLTNNHFENAPSENWFARIWKWFVMRFYTNKSA